MTIDELRNEIEENVEYLQTTNGDEVACIGIKNLEVILSKYTGEFIKINK